MFGTLGFSELVIILVIILIIFGAGRLPQIGEGVGKALRSFKKEVQDAPQPAASPAESNTTQPQPNQPSSPQTAGRPPSHGGAPPLNKPLPPSGPGPEMTPGTTASMLYQMGPEFAQPPRTVPDRPPDPSSETSQPVLSMEERAVTAIPAARASYPPLPAGSRPRPPAQRPSASVNKEAVARVQAQQAALKAKAASAASPDDLQQAGENLGELVRTFRQTAADVRESIEPQVRAIQTELDAASKELRQSLDATTQPPAVQEDRPRPS
ncbi:MAG: twin-arginine translocase TatA/TatE family subunit [Nitrospira sp.]|nr:twin-arginine translocase TatA/TatE family subunit [Nitrospira sp.]